jgi:hypothetical protein
MTDDMRMTTAKWMEGKNNPLQFTGSVTKHASGLLHEMQTLAIVPRSKQARMDMMLNWGQPYNEELNKGLFNITDTSWKASRSCNTLRMQTNESKLIRVNDSFFDAKLIRFVNKHYTRVADEMTFSGGALLSSGNGSPIRMDTPCGDWTVFIAQREAAEEKKEPAFNPLTGEWE